MSSGQHQRTINSLDKDIADLEKKKSQIEKDAAKLQKNIADSKKDISRTKSASTKINKSKQITSWTAELAKKQATIASYSKKIADKQAKRNSEYQKLQHALSEEQKLQMQANKQIQKNYERIIDQFSQHITLSDLVTNREQHSHSEETYDVFISHAWEDKETFVDNFVNKLEQLGMRVWYDTKKIQWGDSMRTNIDEGLRKSTFGIIVLSPHYIAKGKYWTKEELNGLFQLESINGKKILPIWHNLTKEQLMHFSPMIADKKALNTKDMTSEDIAQALKDLLMALSDKPEDS